MALLSKAGNRTLRNILFSDKMEFLMEAHSPLAAKVCEKIGFKAIWASGLSISTLLGRRDCNEISSDLFLNIIELMNDSVNIPILVDGDTGFGNFNNARLFVKKLCSYGVDGVCFEDKLFPKKNSFIETQQLLAPIEEFCGKIKACKDIQDNPDFILVARTEALISGKGHEEALKRAYAYAAVGADAILIHSKKTDANEIIKFGRLWEGTIPLIVVPTSYYNTPVSEFDKVGIKNVIWANHNIRASLSAMLDTTSSIYHQRTVAQIEDKIMAIKDIFKMLDYPELEEAEMKYSWYNIEQCV